VVSLAIYRRGFRATLGKEHNFITQSRIRVIEHEREPLKQGPGSPTHAVILSTLPLSKNVDRQENSPISVPRKELKPDHDY
jgi:hypothetical protein